MDGRELDKQKQMENAKTKLFLTLFSLRYPFPGNFLHPDYIAALNQIDVVFQGHQTVVKAWHNLHTCYSNESIINKEKVTEDLKHQLLTQMGLVVGYDVMHVDFSKSYAPEAHGSERNQNIALRILQLDYYKNANLMNPANLKLLSLQIEYFQSLLGDQDSSEKDGNEKQ